jgi:hypothetical protein
MCRTFVQDSGPCLGAASVQGNIVSACHNVNEIHGLIGVVTCRLEGCQMFCQIE